MSAIRVLTSADLTLWKAIRLEAIREHPMAFDGSYEEEVPQSDQEWIKNLETSFIFAYFNGERPVATAGYFFKALKKKKHRATLFGVYVNREFHGKKIMDQLLHDIIAHAKEHGIEQLHLDVGTYNKSAIGCYERSGFSIYGTEPRALKIDGAYIDEYHMVKYL